MTPLDRRTGQLAAIAVVAWLVVALEVGLLSLRYFEWYASLGLELPYLTVVVLEAGMALGDGWGIVPLGLLLALGIAPLALTPGAPRARWLGLGLAQAAVTALLVIGVLRLPMMTMHQDLDGPHGPPPLVTGAALAAFLLGMAQAVTWIQVMLAALRAPREASLARELGRAAILAALPAGVLAAVARGVVDELRVKGPEPLLVTPELGAAGTAALAVFVGAAWLRLRSPVKAT